METKAHHCRLSRLWRFNRSPAPLSVCYDTWRIKRSMYVESKHNGEALTKLLKSGAALFLEIEIKKGTRSQRGV
jgi:hypothetical protein